MACTASILVPVEERNFMFMTAFRSTLGSPPKDHSNSNSGADSNSGLEQLQHETDNHLVHVLRPQAVHKVPSLYLPVADINQSIVLEASQGYQWL